MNHRQFLVAMLALAAPPAVVLPPLPATSDEVSLEDLKRFPSHEVALINAEFCWKHKRWLEEKSEHWLTIEERDYWLMRCQDEYWRWDVWTDLTGAYTDFANGDREGTLRILKYLRRKLGDDAYYRGDMPPAAAFWCFEIR